MFPVARTDFIPVPHTYTSYHEYPTMEAHYNRSYFARTLPPVPKNCPTPFGIAGMCTEREKIFKDEHENIFILKEKPVTGRQATKDKSKLN